MRAVPIRPDEIRAEYRQLNAEPVRVSVIPAESFEAVLSKPDRVGKGKQQSVWLSKGLLCVSSQHTGGPDESLTIGRSGDLVRIGFNLSQTPLCGSISAAAGQMRCRDTYIFSPPNETSVGYPPF